MKIFRRIRNQYGVLGIRPAKNQLTKKLPFNKRILLGFLLFGYAISSQIMHFFHVASNFMEKMQSFCSILASIIMCICFAAIVFRKATLFEIIDNIEGLLDARFKYPKSKALFVKTNRQVEQLSKIIFILVMKLALQLIMLPKCIISFATYFIIDSGRDSFQLPYPMWFPFDTNNPIGYLIAFILEYIVLGYDFFMMSCTLALGIGAFWFAISATKEIRRVLHLLNDKGKKNQPNEINIILSESIDAHGIVKQMAHDFSDMFQPIIMSLFTWSLIAISGAMLIIQVELLHRGDITVLLQNATLNGIIGLVVVFVACELGQRMSDAFDGINYIIDQFDWYLFPIKIKKMLPIIIAIIQEPITLECFGSIACTRDVFKNFIHRAYSYFTVLCQLGD